MSLRDGGGNAALVGPLPFLRMGEALCIETPGAPPDATARAAHIAGINVEVDPVDGVPQLVVELTRKAADVAPFLGRSAVDRAARLENLVLVLGCATLACAAFLVGYVL
jgi:hypothetical protein